MITDIVRPKTVAEAVTRKVCPGGSLAGGRHVAELRQGPGRHDAGVAGASRPGCTSGAGSGRCCRIGAAVTFQALVDSPLVPHVLKAAARLTASRTLRNMVTVGGELGLRPEDSALIPVLVALGAEVHLAG